MTSKDLYRIAAAIACVAIAAPLSAQSGKPVTGAEVLERMRKKYDGKWFKSLTFSQKTTMAGRGDAAPTIQTWYETLQFHTPAGAWLRIDQGSPADGNGVLYTADSTWRVRGGTAGAAVRDGNPFLPLIENVYLQPVATTVEQLASLHIDMTRVADVTWEGRPAWAVGAAAPDDSTSAQFWIDKDRLIVVRMILALGANAAPYDIHLDNMVATGGGWLATKVTMLRSGVARQTEEYYDWKTNVALDPRLFDVGAWKTATHWVKQP
jgi:hypothetical protein